MNRVVKKAAKRAAKPVLGILGVFVLSALVFNTAMAEGRHCSGHGGGHYGGMERLVFKLDLSNEQKAELQELLGSKKDRREKWRLHSAEKRGFHQAVMAAVRDGATRDEVRTMLHQQVEQKLDRIMARGETYQRVNDMLTDEQREELEILKKERRERMQKHVHKHG